MRALSAVFGRRWVGGVALLAAGLGLFAALVSHSPEDPIPLLRSGPTEATANWLGPVGAVASELLFDLLGLVALAIPLVLLESGRRRLRHPRPNQDPAAVRAIVLASLATGAAGLFALAQGQFAGGGAGFAWGGFFGTMLSSALIGALKPLGAALVLGVLVTISAVSLWPSRRALRQAAPRGWLGRIRRRFFRRKRGQRPPRPVRVVARVARGSGPRAASTDGLAKASAKIESPRTTPAPRHERKDRSPGGDEPAWEMPALSLMTRRTHQPGPGRRILEQRREALEAACREHGVRGHVARIQPGPVVTTFEFRLGEGETLNKLRNRHEEICMALRAPAIRVERVRGKDVVGIEVPNETSTVVGLREILESDEFREDGGALPVAIGRRVDGRPLVGNLAGMPHLLIAGATGSGKSVQLNTLLCSLLVRQSPDDLRLILIDPKRVELRPYRNLPHLLTPLILEPDKAKVVLQHACLELDRRTRLLEEYGARNIDGFNGRVARLRKRQKANGTDELPTLMPRLVIVVDELADLLIHARAEVTPAIQRLLSLGRAEGIHLVLATQRPSTDIISGTLKANLPTRIAFRVASNVDSRTILDRVGAENLLGRGDMLMMRPGADLPRAQGAFVDEGEVEKLAGFWESRAKPEFDEAMLVEEEPATAPLAAAGGKGPAGGARRSDSLLPTARDLIIRERKASTSMLQTELGLGYQRARRIVAELERQGIVGPARGSQPRQVLVEA